MKVKLCILLFFAGAACIVSGGAWGTALDDYVYDPDPAYGYTLLNTVPQPGYTDYILEMTSLTWRSASEVDEPLWKHHLMITVPDMVTTNTGFLFIEGKYRDSAVPGGNNAPALATAAETGAICATIMQIPFQRLTFLDDPTLTPRSEDDMISYTWVKFMETGDPLWLQYFPMTKAAVRAMDTVTAFVADPAHGGHTVDQYVLQGGSKRAWSAWLAAAVDSRAIALGVFSLDLLNIETSYYHQYAALGFWAAEMSYYESKGVMKWMGSRPYHEILELVDPYSYRSRYASKPKYVYNSAGDEIFLSDSSQFYFDDLPGVKHLRYLPNTGHNLDGNVFPDFLAWSKAIVTGAPIPTFTWTKQGDGSLIVNTTGTTPSQVLLWQATNSVRDFNHTLYGDLYTSSPLAPSGPGEYTASLSPPPSGFTAFFVEITYPSGGTYNFRFTTEISVIPDTYVGSWDRDADGDGIRDSLDEDDDNDGVLNASDEWPLDTDDDRFPNYVDEDDDNDTYSDIAEIAAGTDPFDPSSFPGAGGNTVPVTTPAAMAILMGAVALLAVRRLRKTK